MNPTVDIDDGLDDTEEPIQWWKSAPRLESPDGQGTRTAKRGKEQQPKEPEKPYVPKLSKEEIAAKFEQAEALLKKETAKFDKCVLIGFVNSTAFHHIFSFQTIHFTIFIFCVTKSHQPALSTRKVVILPLRTVVYSQSHLLDSYCHN